MIMRTLFVTYHYLHGNGGGVFASRAFINAFAEISDEMTLLYPMKVGADPEHINDNVILVPVWDNRNKIQKAWGLITGQSNRFRSFRRFIGDKHYDTVVFDTSLVVHGIIDFFRGQGTKVVTIHHNYQYEYFRDNFAFPFRLPLLFWSKKYESESVRKSDLNLTLTETDRLQLKRHYGKDCGLFEVLGAFEFERKNDRLYPEVNAPRFLITGDLSTKQTEDSLLPWIDEYYPLLKEIFPKATLTLAGRSPSDSLKRKAEEKGVTVISSPMSMDPILAEAKYYICPTYLGGGLKLRVMDGLSFGLPVICHQISARGYEAFIEEGVLLVYEDPTSFRNQLINLKAFQADKRKGIAIYKQYFSFDSGKQRLTSFLIKHRILS
jgi:glycosyltransferase involved in cell wall biosynthesis